MSERLDFALELKAVDGEQRVIEGYASVTGNVDGQGDTVEPGAFTKTLQTHAPADIPVYIGHKHDELPVGMPLLLREDSHGLFTKTKVFQTRAGDDLLAVARASQAAGRPLGMSIGYNPIDFTWGQSKDGASVRHIKELDLGEYSFTAIPANTAARVMAVKQQKAAVDNSAWDGNAAMAACETAADYEAICAGRRAGDASLRATWALPHHKGPGDPPNASGVRNSLSRLPQTQGLTNKAAAQAHLEAHMAAINPERQASAGRLLAIKAMSGIDPATLGAIAQLDYLIDQADDIVDGLMNTFGIVDPDEACEGCPCCTADCSCCAAGCSCGPGGCPDCGGGQMAAKALQMKAGRRYSSSTSQMLLARLAAARAALDEIEADIKASTDDGKSNDAPIETKTEAISGPWDLEIALAKARGGLNA